MGDCSESAFCSGHGDCVNGLCECHLGWTGNNCTTELLCNYWDETEHAWSSEGLTISPSPNGRPDGFLRCNSTHLTDFGGLARVPMSAEDLLADISSVEFTVFTMDDLADTLTNFDIAGNPQIFSMIFSAIGLDFIMVMFARWRWHRRRLKMKRDAVAKRQKKRDPEYKEKKALQAKVAHDARVRNHAHAFLVAKSAGLPLVSLPPEVRTEVAAIQVQRVGRAMPIRKQFREKKVAAIKLQAVSRGLDVRKQDIHGLLAMKFNPSLNRMSFIQRRAAADGARRSTCARKSSYLSSHVDSATKPLAARAAVAREPEYYAGLQTIGPANGTLPPRSLLNAEAAPGDFSSIIGQTAEPASDQSGMSSLLSRLKPSGAKVLPNKPNSRAVTPTVATNTKALPGKPSSPPPSPPSPRLGIEKAALSGRLGRPTASSSTRGSQGRERRASLEEVARQRTATIQEQRKAAEKARQVAEDRARQAACPRGAASAAASWLDAARASAGGTAHRRVLPPRPPSQSALQDAYETLGIAPGAGHEQVLGAFLLLTRRAREESDAARMRQLAKARDTIEASSRAATVSPLPSAPPLPTPPASAEAAAARAALEEPTHASTISMSSTLMEETRDTVISASTDSASATRMQTPIEPERPPQGSPRPTTAEAKAIIAARMVARQEKRAAAAIAEGGAVAEPATGPPRGWAALRKPQTAAPPAVLPNNPTTTGWGALRNHAATTTMVNASGEVGSQPPAQSAAGAALWKEVRQRQAAKAFTSAKEMEAAFRKALKRDEKLKMRQLVKEKGHVHVLRMRAKQVGRMARGFWWEYWRILQSEHTIVSAVLPNAEDTAGDHLRDENVIHIFWTTMVGELCLISMLTGDAPLLSIATLINGAITCFALVGITKVLGIIFRWGNRMRWKRDAPPSVPVRVWRYLTGMPAKLRLQANAKRERRQQAESEGPRRAVWKNGKLVVIGRASTASDSQHTSGSSGVSNLSSLTANSKESAESDAIPLELAEPIVATYQPNKKLWLKTQFSVIVPWDDDKMYAKATMSLHCPPLRRSVVVTLPDERPRGGALKIKLTLPIYQHKQDFEISRAAITSGPPPRPSRTPTGSRASSRASSRPRSQSNFILLSPRLHLFRFTLAWVVTVLIFLVFCLFAITYGVTMGPSQVNEVMLAWLLALVFTWALVEPTEVMVVIAARKNETLLNLRNKLRDYGFI